MIDWNQSLIRVYDWVANCSVASCMLHQTAETVYRVYRYLETGASIADYQDHYMRNKQRCGRKRTQLSLAELAYINDKIARGVDD